TGQLRRDAKRLGRAVAQCRREHAHLIGLTQPIAVVIPAHDCLDLTQRCLQHLAWYAGLPVDVIYVDNGSPPPVPEQVAEIAKALGLPITIARNSTNEHFTKAVNRGIELAKGKHVLCLNNDCFIAPDCLEHLYWQLARSGQRVAAVGPLTGDREMQSLRHPV